MTPRDAARPPLPVRPELPAALLPAPGPPRRRPRGRLVVPCPIRPPAWAARAITAITAIETRVAALRAARIHAGWGRAHD